MTLLRKALRRLTCAFRKVQGAHPYMLNGNPNRRLMDFELATQILSILAFNLRLGPIKLVCDEAAFKYLSGCGITDLYDAVELAPDFSSVIDTKRFWAFGKIVALQRMRTPCMVVDPDVVIYRHPSLWTCAMALHTEPKSFCSYGYNRMWDHLRHVAPHGMCLDHRDVEPYNTGVLGFNCPKAKVAYTTTSMALMKRASEAGSISDDLICVPGINSAEKVPVSEMIFAEQMLLAILADNLRFSVGTYGKYDTALDHMTQQWGVMHLWNSKRFLAQHGRAKEVYMNWVMEEIYQFRRYKKWNLVAAAVRKSGLPYIRVHDSNIDSVRWSYSGEWRGPGETMITV